MILVLYTCPRDCSGCTVAVLPNNLLLRSSTEARIWFSSVYSVLWAARGVVLLISIVGMQGVFLFLQAVPSLRFAQERARWPPKTPYMIDWYFLG